MRKSNICNNVWWFRKALQCSDIKQVYFGSSTKHIPLISLVWPWNHIWYSSQYMWELLLWFLRIFKYWNVGPLAAGRLWLWKGVWGVWRVVGGLSRLPCCRGGVMRLKYATFDIHVTLWRSTVWTWTGSLPACQGWDTEADLLLVDNSQDSSYRV